MMKLSVRVSFEAKRHVMTCHSPVGRMTLADPNDAAGPAKPGCQVDVRDKMFTLQNQEKEGRLPLLMVGSGSFSLLSWIISEPNTKWVDVLRIRMEDVRAYTHKS